MEDSSWKELFLKGYSSFINFDNSQKIYANEIENNSNI